MSQHPISPTWWHALLLLGISALNAHARPSPPSGYGERWDLPPAAWIASPHHDPRRCEGALAHLQPGEWLLVRAHPYHAFRVRRLRAPNAPVTLYALPDPGYALSPPTHDPAPPDHRTLLALQLPRSHLGVASLGPAQTHGWVGARAHAAGWVRLEGLLTEPRAESWEHLEGAIRHASDPADPWPSTPWRPTTTLPGHDVAHALTQLDAILPWPPHLDDPPARRLRRAAWVALTGTARHHHTAHMEHRPWPSPPDAPWFDDLHHRRYTWTSSLTRHVDGPAWVEVHARGLWSHDGAAPDGRVRFQLSRGPHLLDTHSVQPPDLPNTAALSHLASDSLHDHGWLHPILTTPHHARIYVPPGRHRLHVQLPERPAWISATTLLPIEFTGESSLASLLELTPPSSWQGDALRALLHELRGEDDQAIDLYRRWTAGWPFRWGPRAPWAARRLLALALAHHDLPLAAHALDHLPPHQRTTPPNRRLALAAAHTLGRTHEAHRLARHVLDHPRRDPHELALAYTLWTTLGPPDQGWPSLGHHPGELTAPRDLHDLLRHGPAASARAASTRWSPLPPRTPRQPLRFLRPLQPRADTQPLDPDLLRDWARALGGNNHDTGLWLPLTGPSRILPPHQPSTLDIRGWRPARVTLDGAPVTLSPQAPLRLRLDQPLELAPAHDPTHLWLQGPARAWWGRWSRTRTLYATSARHPLTFDRLPTSGWSFVRLHAGLPNPPPRFDLPLDVHGTHRHLQRLRLVRFHAPPSSDAPPSWADAQLWVAPDAGPLRVAPHGAATLWVDLDQQRAGAPWTPGPDTPGWPLPPSRTSALLRAPALDPPLDAIARLTQRLHHADPTHRPRLLEARALQALRHDALAEAAADLDRALTLTDPHAAPRWRARVHLERAALAFHQWHVPSMAHHTRAALRLGARSDELCALAAAVAMSERDLPLAHAWLQRAATLPPAYAPLDAWVFGRAPPAQPSFEAALSHAARWIHTAAGASSAALQRSSSAVRQVLERAAAHADRRGRRHDAARLRKLAWAHQRLRRRLEHGQELVDTGGTDPFAVRVSLDPVWLTPHGARWLRGSRDAWWSWSVLPDTPWEITFDGVGEVELGVRPWRSTPDRPPRARLWSDDAPEVDRWILSAPLSPDVADLSEPPGRPTRSVQAEDRFVIPWPGPARTLRLRASSAGTLEVRRHVGGAVWRRGPPARSAGLLARTYDAAYDPARWVRWADTLAARALRGDVDPAPTIRLAVALWAAWGEGAERVHLARHRAWGNDLTRVETVDLTQTLPRFRRLRLLRDDLGPDPRRTAWTLPSTPGAVRLGPDGPRRWRIDVHHRAAVWVRVVLAPEGWVPWSEEEEDGAVEVRAEEGTRRVRVRPGVSVWVPAGWTTRPTRVWVEAQQSEGAPPWTGHATVWRVRDVVGGACWSPGAWCQRVRESIGLRAHWVEAGASPQAPVATPGLWGWQRWLEEDLEATEEPGWWRPRGPGQRDADPLAWRASEARVPPTAAGSWVRATQREVDVAALEVASREASRREALPAAPPVGSRSRRGPPRHWGAARWAPLSREQSWGNELVYEPFVEGILRERAGRRPLDEEAGRSEVRVGARMHHAHRGLPLYSRLEVVEIEPEGTTSVLSTELRLRYVFTRRPEWSLRLRTRGTAQALGGRLHHSQEADLRSRLRVDLPGRLRLQWDLSLNAWRHSSDPQPGLYRGVYTDYRRDHNLWLAWELRLRWTPWQDQWAEVFVGQRSNRDLEVVDPDRVEFGVAWRAHWRWAYVEADYRHIHRFADEDRRSNSSEDLVGLGVWLEGWLGAHVWGSIGCSARYALQSDALRVVVGLRLRLGRAGVRSAPVDPQLVRFARYQDGSYPWPPR